MRVLVTGATGFIGCHLAQALARQEYEVVATGRAVAPSELARAEHLRLAGVPLYTGSLLESGFARQVTSDCRAVIHLAAAQHEGNVADSYFRDVNVTGTRRLLEAAVAAGARRFVYGSTIGVYGSATQGELDEDSAPCPQNIYGVTKLEAERVTTEFSGSIETCCVRISETYGPDDLRLLKLFRAIDRGAFFMIGSGGNLRQVIHVDDLVNGLQLAAEHPAAVGETFVLAGVEVMTTATMVAHIASALGRRTPRLRVPVWPFRAAAAVLESTLRPLGIQPPLTQRRLDFFTKSFRFSTRKPLRVLGFEAKVPFATGAGTTAAWYRDHGWLGSA
jgi:nucleoside-diphosphate-sugar epimerase